MFIESPVNPEDNFRFIADPSSIRTIYPKNHAKYQTWMDPYLTDIYATCLTFIVPKSIKIKVDTIFQNLFENKSDLNFNLEKIYGEVIADKINHSCQAKECLDFCFCKNEKKPGIQSHIIYHKILEKCAEATDRTIDDTIEFFKSDYMSDQYGSYDFSNNKEKEEYPILNDIDCILHTLMDPSLGHLKKIGLDGYTKWTLLDKNAFTNCQKNICSFDHRKEVIWESKSKISVQVGIERFKQPRAKIFGHECICRSKERMYELVEDGWDNIKDSKLDNLLFEYFVSALQGRGYENVGKKSSSKRFNDQKITSPSSKIAAEFLAHKILKKSNKKLVLAETRDVKGKKILSASAKRHSKAKLKKTLTQVEKFIELWPDFKEVLDLIDPK